MTNILKLSFSVLIVSTFTSCYYDKEELLYPKNTQICDSTNVSFSAKLVPIFSTYCYSCHSQAIATGNIILEGYDNVKVIAQNGRLIGSITHSPGFRPMPDAQPKLSDCNIALIRNWIKEGMQNN